MDSKNDEPKSKEDISLQPLVDSVEDSLDNSHEKLQEDDQAPPPIRRIQHTHSYPPSLAHVVDHGDNGFPIPEFDAVTAIDINQYQHRKTLAKGMMDLALFSANANQLRYVVESFDLHPYYWPNLILISFSIILQVVIGLGLILNSRYNIKNEDEIHIANKINNYTVIGIFLVTAVNIFISAFGVPNMPLPLLQPV